MQYHLDGYTPGDPFVQPAAADLTHRDKAFVDVLIVGCGPAGLTLAAQLAAFPDIRTRIVEKKAGPLQLGQADGIACRTVEMFEAFGFSERALREAYWVNETSFWAPSGTDRTLIERTGRIQDVEDDLSEMPHLILNQARVHQYFLDVMRDAPARLTPDYHQQFETLSMDPSQAYPVTVTLKGPNGLETLKARYAVGCDGARSGVRRAIGHELVGDSANQAWGVMDVLAVTDFPDIRLKSVIRSAGQGNILIIPREGGYLVRLYIEMDKLAPDERVSGRNISADDLVAAAKRILHPYTLEVKEIVWWSVYEIGQRLCASFDNGEDPRVFIAGDACHTHSPKAGQGMNVSVADAFNLGWKLSAVLRGQAQPDVLATYTSERQRVAQDLITFDRHWARRFSEREETGGATDPNAFRDYFAEHGRFTAGVATQYAPSMLVGTGAHQSLARGLVVGTRFHSATVRRLWDARVLQLSHAFKADGRWRIVLFGDTSEPTDTESALWRLCDWLQTDGASPIRHHTPANANMDEVIDLRAVFQQGHQTIPAEKTHPILTPQKGLLNLQDREKMYCADTPDIYDMRGIDRAQGCIVIVRPDQYVSDILPLDANDALASFFRGALLPASRVSTPA